MLTRAQHTLDLMLAEIGQTGLPTTKNLALNERDYGDLSGLNKDDARKKWGEDQVLIWRRSYDVPPPGGESLKDTLARTLPYYVQEILPGVLRGERTLVAAHGNSLRALIMVLEKLTPEQILKRELATGVPVIYRLNADSTVASKLDLAGELEFVGWAKRSVPTIQSAIADRWWARRYAPLPTLRMSMQSHLPGFPAEHRLLAGDAPVIAGQRAALAERAMAGHHERDRVACRPRRRRRVRPSGC